MLHPFDSNWHLMRWSSFNALLIHFDSCLQAIVLFKRSEFFCICLTTKVKLFKYVEKRVAKAA